MNVPKKEMTKVSFHWFALRPPRDCLTYDSGNCTMSKSCGENMLGPNDQSWGCGGKAVLENATSFEQTAEPPETRCLLRILREWYRKHWWKLQQATQQLSWKTTSSVEHLCPDLDSAIITYNTSESFRVYADAGRWPCQLHSSWQVSVTMQLMRDRHSLHWVCRGFVSDSYRHGPPTPLLVSDSMLLQISAVHVMMWN